MPLTPSHAAAALLLERVLPRLPLAALVIGSMSPDFEYLLRLTPRGEFGHTPLGLIVFCLPIGLAVRSVYRAWLRPVALDLLPPGLAVAIAPRCEASWRAGALAVLLGAASHVAWDAFTHADGFFVGLLPSLASEAWPTAAPGLRWYKLLQHASTVLGALVIAAVALRWLGRHPASARRFAPGQARRVVVALSAMLLISALGAVLNGVRVADRSVAVVLAYAAVGAMVGFALASVVVATHWHTKKRTQSG
jgi:hypothetical protein